MACYNLDLEDQISIVEDDYENQNLIFESDSDSGEDDDTAASSRPPPLAGRFADVNVQRIKEGTHAYNVVKESFLIGMADLRKKIEIVGIFRKVYNSDVMSSTRYETFQAYSAAVAAKNGGDSNVKLAWYGGPREEIHEILSFGFGFGLSRRQQMNQSYGHGVHLTPATLSIESLRSSMVDADGVRHMLLCRATVGKPEVCHCSLDRYRPSSVEYDSAVDDLSSPRKYIIHEYCLDTHVIPVFMISFKVMSSKDDVIRVPKSPHLSMSKLLKVLGERLGASKMVSIGKQHREFVGGKIPRVEFIRSLREIAGDDVLRGIVRVYGPKEKMEIISGRMIGA